MLGLLTDRSEKKLISYQDTTLTKNEFISLVEYYYQKITDDERLSTKKFIIINEVHPIRFYLLLFALLKNENRICFPNRDYLAGTIDFNFCEYSTAIRDGQIVVKREPFDDSIEIPDEGCFVVFSSGSTGKPKGVVHNPKSLLNNAYFSMKEIGLKEYVSLTPLNPYLVSALSHFLVHFLSDSHIIFTDFKDDSQVAHWYGQYNNLSVVGSPMHVLTTIHSIPNGMSPRFFFSSGDFMYPVNIKKILNKYPSSNYFNVYGLAELGGRFFINKISSNTEYYQYSSLGRNLSNTECWTVDGQLHVKSESLFLGYIYNDNFIPSHREHPTGDIVLEENGVKKLYGRVNDEIKIGGNKISLSHIEEKINSLFDDDTCVLFDIKHPRLGTLFALAIHTDRICSRSEIMLKLKGHLQPYEIPHYFYYLKDMYYTQTMKIDRKKIKDSVESLLPIR